MEPAALGRAAKRRGKASLRNPGVAQAPAASVLAPADLEQVPTPPAAADPPPFSKVVAVGIYFFLGAVLYNGYVGTNKNALDETYLHWSVAATQQFVGCALVVVLWMLKIRPVPRLTLTSIKLITPIAVCHTLSHVCIAVGLGDGYSHDFSDFFAAEAALMATRPLFTALFSTIFQKQTLSRWVYPTLVLSMAGGATMVMVEDCYHPDCHVTWVCMGGAIGFNLAASMRTVLAKRSMGMDDTGDNMSPGNLYALVTILSSAMFLPLCIIIEDSDIDDLWWATFELDGGGWLAVTILLSGICSHLYNEVSFQCLGLVDPLTHTVKHAFVLISILIIDDYDWEVIQTMGHCVAITGVLLYILAGTIEALLCRQRDRNA